MKHLNKYVGRSFDIGKVDCYQLTAEFYREEFNVDLTMVEYPSNWIGRKDDAMMDLHQEVGFKLMQGTMKELKYGDVLVCAIASPHGNHLAIYVGQNKVLHHLLNRQSCIEPMNRLVYNTCVGILRHPDVTATMTPKTKVDLMDLLPPHKQQELKNAKENTNGKNDSDVTPTL